MFQKLSYDSKMQLCKLRATFRRKNVAVEPEEQKDAGQSETHI